LKDSAFSLSLFEQIPWQVSHLKGAVPFFYLNQMGTISALSPAGLSGKGDL